MSLRLEKISMANFRCFQHLEIRLERDLTLLFAENGGGKTALLKALAMGIALFQPRSPKALKGDPQTDIHQVTLSDLGAREPAGNCALKWEASSAEGQAQWSLLMNSTSERRVQNLAEIESLLELIRKPGERWPLFAWYGTERLRARPQKRRPPANPYERWDAYNGSLDSSLTEGPLLDWLMNQMISDVGRDRKGEPQRRYDDVVMQALVRATPGLEKVFFDPVEGAPMLIMDKGRAVPWRELSDGYHAFLSLVADIARRAVSLNDFDGEMATELVEGLVLVDEIDLHLHPKWQRTVLRGLRSAFPKLQFVVSTHSPQVLSSVENRQVRHLDNGQLVPGPITVEGRDTNAILRDHMDTEDRDEEGKDELQRLYYARDHGDRQEFERRYTSLVERWGDLDPELIRARAMVEWDEQ